MSHTTIYIAGAVTEPGIELAARQFLAKEQELRAQGFRVLNPVKLVLQHNKQNDSWENIMRFLIPFVCESDILYVMRGWETSKGVNVERDLCRRIGIEIRYEQ